MRASGTDSCDEVVWLPGKVYIHKDSMDSPLVERIRERVGKAEIEIMEETPRFRRGEGSVDTLYIVPQRSTFLQRCPGTHGYYICCGYKIFDLVHNCVFGCSYCILRSYFQDRSIIAFSNIEEGLDELEQEINGHPDRVYRIGTGEFSDSLGMDYLFDHGGLLIPFFSRFDNAVLELKTKSTSIGALEHLPHNGRTIVSWSLNPQVILDRLERGTPSLKQRLLAAAACSSWGYKIGFHFDPIIYFPGWEKEYESIIREIFLQVDEDNIAWISLGTLRFPVTMKPFLSDVEKDSFLNQGETVRGVDGKIRYFKPLRISILKKMVRYLFKHGGNPVTYLCMESPEVWNLVYPKDPGYHDRIKHVLDKQALK